MAKSKNPHIGSSFESFLQEEGLYEEVTQSAIKAVLARQIAGLMEEERITKTAMAKRMDTSRAALNRLLDPEHEGVTLATLTKAARAIGRELRFELV
jgi:DNA-binding Xre family transcriptional regulator